MLNFFNSLEDADYLLPLSPNWQSWTSFFNDIASLMASRDRIVTPQTRCQYCDF
jgi:hypothetical protein